MTEFARTKLSDHVVLHVSRQIVRGALVPGDNLPSEPELAVEFGVSKPVVRESLRALATLGMVRVQQGKRTLVQEPSEWNVLDPRLQEVFELEGRGGELAVQLYDLRHVLEASSAARAAAKATPAQVEVIVGLARQLAELAATTRDVEEFLVVDREFHDAVARGSGNEVLRQVVRNVHEFLTRAWSRQSISEDDLVPLAAVHASIAAAIAEGDVTRAAREMSDHLQHALTSELGRITSPQVAAADRDLATARVP